MLELKARTEYQVRLFFMKTKAMLLGLIFRLAWPMPECGLELDHLLEFLGINEIIKSIIFS